MINDKNNKCTINVLHAYLNIWMRIWEKQTTWFDRVERFLFIDDLDRLTEIAGKQNDL